MWLDINPLRKNIDFRNLYLGQCISFLGSMLSLVVLPYQIYELTQSTLAVGLLGVAELLPLLLTAFIGGALADVIDRKKILIRSEIGMMIAVLILILNSLLPEPQIWVLFLMAAILSGLSGFHRPALDAMTSRLVKHNEILAVSALTSLKFTIGTIGGPALAGLCIATLGVTFTFCLDFLTFLISLFLLLKVNYTPSFDQTESISIKSTIESVRYAIKRPELLGSYVVDFFAMIFGMPNALFPALSANFGGPKMIGWLYAAPSIGALILTLFSGWTKYFRRHGMGVILASLVWGIAITAFGFCTDIGIAMLCLGLAGAADCVSGIFRTTLWNETIPDRLRGRMAGLEMISYMSGPLLGNAEAGLVASFTNEQVSIVSGGVLCILSVIVCSLFLPAFWRYKAEPLAREVEETPINLQQTNE